MKLSITSISTQIVKFCHLCLENVARVKSNRVVNKNRILKRQSLVHDLPAICSFFYDGQIQMSKKCKLQHAGTGTLGHGSPNHCIVDVICLKNKAQS